MHILSRLSLKLLCGEGQLVSTDACYIVAPVAFPPDAGTFAMFENAALFRPRQQNGWDAAAEVDFPAVFSLTCTKSDGELIDISALFRRDESAETKIADSVAQKFADLANVYVQKIKYLRPADLQPVHITLPSYQWRRLVLGRGSRSISLHNHPANFGNISPLLKKKKVNLNRCLFCFASIYLDGRADGRKVVTMLCCGGNCHLDCYDT